jgi:NADH-quinone oxidoreductase subunit G
MSAVMEQDVDMVNIEVDGIPLEVPRNSMIIEATDKAGIAVPRFCYHRKLTVAANCRMCLVDVEKAPKPMPACATPVMDGMKVFTQSRRAIDAQHGVMEFLLINHPLDCPICDQGGECELQDLAMGYGRSVSRFTERKRVVKDKNVGPLIQTDMTRCIHCTRCVRFLEEVAGTSEMGGTGRGDRTEIGTCLETSIDSELSGNVIDLCPVGALTNKPFRYSARAWELVAQPSHAQHDGLGSALHYHTRRGQVMRAVPRDLESVNEAWLSDRDRYSHFGLYAKDRLERPAVRKDGEWADVSWEEAFEAAGLALKAQAGDDLGILMSPSATSEAFFLARRLADGLGCAHIDHRGRETDFRDDAVRPAVFGATIEAVETMDTILLVGCNPRHEAPILGHRVRKASLAGAKVLVLNPLAWNFHFDVADGMIAAPQEFVAELAGLVKAVAEATGTVVPEAFQEVVNRADAEAYRGMAEQLKQAERGLVLVGQAAMTHGDAAWLRQLSAWLAEATGAALNLLPHGGNTTGATAMGAVPAEGGLNARAMLEQPRKAYLLWDLEPDQDIDNPQAAMKALGQADHVVAVSSYAGPALRKVATVLLPLAAWPETEGSFLNLEGRRFDVRPAARAVGEARPGWKMLRRLGSTCGLGGFDQVSLAEVQAAMPEGPSTPEGTGITLGAPIQAQGLHRIGEVPMYSADAMTRRAEPLQKSVHARNDFVGLNPADADSLGLDEGSLARVSQNGDAVELTVRRLDAVPAGAAWVRTATDGAAVLGDAMGPINVARTGAR